jgi:hypothetical protein
MSSETVAKKRGRPAKKAVVFQDGGAEVVSSLAVSNAQAKKSSTATSASLAVKTAPADPTEKIATRSKKLKIVAAKSASCAAAAAPASNQKKASIGAANRAAALAAVNKEIVITETPVEKASMQLAKKVVQEAEARRNGVDPASSTYSLKEPLKASKTKVSPKTAASLSPMMNVETNVRTLATGRNLSSILQRATAFSKQSRDLREELVSVVEGKQSRLSKPQSVSRRTTTDRQRASPFVVAAEARSEQSTSAPAPDAALPTSTRPTHIASESVQSVSAQPQPPQQPSQQTQTSIPLHLLFPRGGIPQIRTFSSTPPSPLPFSTTRALLARQTPHLPQPPTQPSHAPSEPQPLTSSEVKAFNYPVSSKLKEPRLSELPLHELKKNPRYRAAWRKYVSVVTALPIVIVTSWLLYGKCKTLASIHDPLCLSCGMDVGSVLSLTCFGVW